MLTVQDWSGKQSGIIRSPHIPNAVCFGITSIDKNTIKKGGL
jgi:hypothetical protein